MHENFWHQRWESNQITFHEKDFNKQLQIHWPLLAIPSHATIFVPLAGKSNDILWLHQCGYNVLGVEISPIAIHRFFSDNNLTPTITHSIEGFEAWSYKGITLLLGDFFNLKKEHLKQCSAVYDRAALIAMPETMQTQYAEHLCSIIPQDTSMLLITVEYEKGTIQGPPFSINTSQVKKFYHTFYDIQIPTQTATTKNVLNKYKEKQEIEIKENIFILTNKK